MGATANPPLDRAPTRRCTRAALPRGGGYVDCTDRRAFRAFARNDQRLLLRPDREEARAVKARYQGVCRGCGAYTQPRNGKGDAYAYCKACHPGAIKRRWTRERVLEAMARLADRYGRLPSSYDWSRTHARRRGGEALERLGGGVWPAASIVTRLFGTWAAASAAARLQESQSAQEAADVPGVGQQVDLAA